jgi:hypothetical protein
MSVARLNVAPVDDFRRALGGPHDPGLFGSSDTPQPVDEMVENLCCTWGERWKITEM